MSIIRTARPDHNFYMLNKSISEDRRLGWAARGLLIYLLGKPDHWKVSIPALIAETKGAVAKTGRDGIYSLLNEIKAAGYARHETSRDASGKVTGCDWKISEVAAHGGDAPHLSTPKPSQPETAEAGALVSIESPSRIESSKSPITPFGSQSLPGLNLPPKPTNSPQAASVDTATLIDAWNHIVGSKGIPKVAAMTDARKTALLARYAELGGTDPDWFKFCRRISKSPLLTGDNDREWRAGFDWCLKPANFLKIIEGNYDPKGHNSGNREARFEASPGTI